MTIGRRNAIPSVAFLGLLAAPWLGCGSDSGSLVADARPADAKVDLAGTGGLAGMGGQIGAGGGIEAGIPASGGVGGSGGYDGSSAGGSGGTVDAGGPLGTGGCASVPMCDPEDQTLGYGPGYDDPSRCPVERECYYLQGSCGPTACLLRAGVSCNDPLACNPGDFPTDDDPVCLLARQCYRKNLCGKAVFCRRSVDAGPSVDVAVDGGGVSDVALGEAGGVDVALGEAAAADVAVDASRGLDSVEPFDGAACNRSAEYSRQYVADSPAACAALLYVCPANTTGFENECGCGCEQSSSCPQFVDCMPGAGPGDPLCDPSNDQCPYTVRAM